MDTSDTSHKPATVDPRVPSPVLRAPGRGHASNFGYSWHLFEGVRTSETDLTWDPVHAAWRAHHPEDHLDEGVPCARCSTPAGAVKVGEVVSRKFTAWDTWADTAGTHLCQPCTWGYRTAQLRSSVYLVTWHRIAPTAQALDTAGLRQVLAAGGLGSQAALSLPLRAGRKHVLPVARFGQVCVDGANITWSKGDARRLLLVERLRDAGIPARAFYDPVPPWRALHGCEDPLEMLTDWQELGTWRQGRLWLEAALAATHPTTAAAA